MVILILTFINFYIFLYILYIEFLKFYKEFYIFVIDFEIGRVDSIRWIRLKIQIIVIDFVK